jgi:hypothetical protein
MKTSSTKQLLRNLGLGLAALCLGSSAFAQAPANDNCSGAITLSVNSTCVGTAGNATGATQSQAGCTGTANDDVWYKFVATSTSHNVSVTGASGYDAVLQVFSGTCGSLSSLSCRDVTFGGGTETATLTGLTAGATYFVRVYDWYSSTLANPSFTVCVVGVAPPADPCLGVNNISCGATSSISLTGSGAWNVNACGFSTPGNEKVYTFTAPVTGSYTFTVTGGTGGYIDWFYKPTAAGCSSTGWTCIDDISGSGTVSISLTAGTYYLLGDAETTSAVTQNFSISCGTPLAANDDCSGAKPLACGQTLTGSTTSTSPDNAAACGGLAVGTGGGVWYKVVGTGGFMSVSTCNAATNYDTKLHVYAGSCSALTCVTANDDYFSTPYTCGTSSLSSIAEWCSVSGQTYYVLVTGYLASTGNFGITLDCNSAPAVAISPVGPFCQGAASVTLSASPLGGTFSGTGVSSSGVFSPAAAGPGTHTITYTVCGISATTTITVIATPANDACGSAITVAAGNSYSGNTTCATADGGITYCGTTGGTAPGVWYSFVGDGKRWSFSACNGGTDYDTKLHAFTGNCGALVCVDGNDDLGSACATGPGVASFKSGLSFCTTIGRTYYVLVHGFSTSAGNYQLDVTSTPGPSGSISASTYACGFNVSCFGASNGSATVSGSGGAGLYSYNWSNGQIGATATGLSAGTYSVTITDANGCQGTASVTLTQPSAVTANAGANTTVIFGYPSASNCANLTASGAGGCAPYSYAWSNGGSGATINVCPSATTDYTVTVTDANGCSATDVVRVCVNNVVCGRAGNNPKIAICHLPPGNPSNAQTLCIAYPAVNAHLNHGDYLGACGSNTLPCLDGSSNAIAKAAAAADEMEISAYPNPFQRSTTVKFSVASDEQVTVKVYNMLGAEVAVLFEGPMAAGEAREVAFTPANAAQGMYMVKVSTASGASMTKRVTME